MVTVFKNAVLLDGTAQMKPLPDAAVFVENGKIRQICQHAGTDSRMQVIDLRGKYLMPGLINLHCHLPGDGTPQTIDASVGNFIQEQLRHPVGRSFIKNRCGDNAKIELLSGVTTIRTVGGFGDIDSQLREEISAGTRQGPRILAGNEALTVPGGHMAGSLACIVTSVEEAVEQVRRIAQGKPDLIKLMITGGSLDIRQLGEEYRVLMPEKMVAAVCDAAHQLGLPVAAHVQGSAGIRAAINNGVDTVEHGGELDDALAEAFCRKGVSWISTLSPVAVMAALPQKITGISDLYKKSCDQFFREIVSGTKKALAWGIPVGMGVDNGSPYITHYDMWREVEYFRKYMEVTPEFALHSATLKNAVIAGIDGETGSVEPGKSADFLVVDENPLEDLSALRNPSMVVMRGEIYDHPQVTKNQEYEQLLDRIM